MVLRLVPQLAGGDGIVAAEKESESARRAVLRLSSSLGFAQQSTIARSHVASSELTWGLFASTFGPQENQDWPRVLSRRAPYSRHGPERTGFWCPYGKSVVLR